MVSPQDQQLSQAMGHPVWSLVDGPFRRKDWMAPAPTQAMNLIAIG